MSILNRIVAAIWRDLYPKVEAVVDKVVTVAHAVEAKAEAVAEKAQEVALALPPPAPPPGRMLEEILAASAAEHKQRTGETLDWEHSIVDLMKLVGVDASLANRRQLAREFGYRDIFTGAAADNIWLRDRFLAWLRRQD